MSDFLTNLAARTLGAPTLRPRLRSRFEPAPAADGGIAFEAAPPRLSQGPIARVDRTAEPLRRMNVDAAPAMPRATPQRSSPLAPSETKRRADDDHTSPPASTAVAVHLSQPPIATTPRKTIVAAPAAISPSRSTPAAERDVTESIIETREIIVREPAAPAAASEDAPPPVLPRHRYDEQPPRIERTVVSRETHFANVPQRHARAPQRMEVPAPPEPVIQVSIGRVEVRAATPPPKIRQNRAAGTAAMTIDDYAARRNAKGRR